MAPPRPTWPPVVALWPLVGVPWPLVRMREKGDPGVREWWPVLLADPAKKERRIPKFPRCAAPQARPGIDRSRGPLGGSSAKKTPGVASQKIPHVISFTLAVRI